MESILTSIKKMLGITEEYQHFDVDLIMHINTILSILTQLGVGPSEGFFIEDDTATWYDFLPADTNFEMVKTYTHLRVKTVFDPPANSVLLDSMNRMINELEWRISILAEQMVYQKPPSNDTPSDDPIPPQDEPQTIFTVNSVTIADRIITLNYDGQLPNDIPEFNVSLTDGIISITNNGNYDMNFSIKNGKLYLSDEQNVTTVFNISNVSMFNNQIVITYDGEAEQIMPVLHIDITEGNLCIDNNGNNNIIFSITEDKELEVQY